MLMMALAGTVSAAESGETAAADVDQQLRRSADPLVRILALAAVDTERKEIARSVRDRRDDVLLQRLIFEMDEAAPDIDAGWFAEHAPRDKYHWVMKLGAEGVIGDAAAVDRVLARIASPETQATEWRELLWRLWQANEVEVPKCLWERSTHFDVPVDQRPLLETHLSSQWSIKEDYRLLPSVCAADRLTTTAERRRLCLDAGRQLELGETEDSVVTGQELQGIALDSKDERDALELRRNHWHLVNGIADVDPAHRMRMIEVGGPRAKLEEQAHSNYVDRAPEILAALPVPAPAPKFVDLYAKEREDGRALRCGEPVAAQEERALGESLDLMKLWTRLGSGTDPVVTWLTTFRMHPDYDTRLTQAEASEEPIIQRSLMFKGGGCVIEKHVPKSRGSKWLLSKEPDTGLDWLFALNETQDDADIDRALERIAALGVRSDFTDVYRRMQRVADETIDPKVWDGGLRADFAGDLARARETIKLEFMASFARMGPNVPSLWHCSPSDLGASPLRRERCLDAARKLESADSIGIVLDGLRVQRALVDGAELAGVQKRIAAWERIAALEPGDAGTDEQLTYLRELQDVGEAKAKRSHAERVRGKDWTPLAASLP